MALLVTILIIGSSGIIAQIIILRELLVSFYGNELTIGVILANWVILEAAGVFIFGKIIERVKNKAGAFISLNILFSLFLPFCLYFSRVFKGIIGIPFAEAVSLSGVFVVSFIIILPLAFLHGALFSCGAKVYSLRSARLEDSIGLVYAWEAFGSLIGGIILAYLLIPFLDSFQIVFIVSFLGLALALNLVCFGRAKLISTGILLSLSGLIFIPVTGYLQAGSIKKQWQNDYVVDYRNSNYANIAVTKRLTQYTFFYNGLPLITTPFPDKQFVGDFGNLPLLFHASPRRVLVAGAGIGGLVNEILRHKLEKLDYVETDPLIIKLLKKYPTSLSEAEFGDRRVSIINTDPRFFLKRSKGLYDLILIGFSNQADLSSNRLFTEEFFTLAKKRLNANGLISLWLPGSLTYLSQEYKDLNGCVLNSLNSAYKYVRVIPGDYNIFIASDSLQITQVNANVIAERIAGENIGVGQLLPDYLSYRLSDSRLDWFNRQVAGATTRINRDLRPIAVYATLKITNKKFSPYFNRLFNCLSYLNLKAVFLAIFLGAALVLCISKLMKSRKIPLAYAIFTTGFFGMTVSLILIFAYQVFYGSLYQKISVLAALFMAGAAAGGILAVFGLARSKNPKLLLVALEGLIAIFALGLGAFIPGLSSLPQDLGLIFYLLLFISGLLMGLEFPLAGRLYLGNTSNVGGASGLLYACDLFGGWLAGIFGAVAFLPLLGFLDTCLVMVMLKLSSLIVLYFSSWR